MNFASHYCPAFKKIDQNKRNLLISSEPTSGKGPVNIGFTGPDQALDSPEEKLASRSTKESFKFELKVAIVRSDPNGKI